MNELISSPYSEYLNQISDIRKYYHLDMRIFDASVILLKYIQYYRVDSKIIISGFNYVRLHFIDLNYVITLSTEGIIITTTSDTEHRIFSINEESILGIISCIKTLHPDGNYDE